MPNPNSRPATIDLHRRWARSASLVATLILLRGCGLGFIEIEPVELVSLRIENAAPDVAEVTVSTTGAKLPSDSETTGLIGDSIDSVIRVQSGDVSTGSILCGSMLNISVMIGGESPLAVDLEGAGTGTPGFDSGSVGLTGERFLIEGLHYSCNDTVLVQLQRSDAGELIVVPQGGILPEPITDGAATTDSGGQDNTTDPETPDDDAGTATTDVGLIVANQTESTVQINFSLGDGSLDGGDGTGLVKSVDVRVPPFSTTRGTGACTEEYIVTATHLEGTSSVSGSGGVNFHAVVLTGDGTGTSGFDSISLAVSGGRLLLRGTHFECGDDITVTVTATNNQVQLDEEGQPALDEFGSVTIKYNVGLGRINVAQVAE